MQTTYDTIALERVGAHVALLTFDRPQRANAMNTQMGIDLRQVFTELYVDAGDIRCLVVTGRGEKVFSAGGDLKDRDGMTPAQWQSQHAIFEQMMRALRECPIPVLGAINGAAYGGGCEFALACDFLYAAEHARFALTEITLGIMPGAGGTMNLPLAVGERRAREIIYTGKPFTAAEAFAWGLVNQLLPGSGAARGNACHGGADRGECADFRAPGEEIDGGGDAGRSSYGIHVRTRSLQPHDPDGRSARRRACVQ